MNKELIIQMAREAGLFVHKEVQPEIERFFQLATEWERKRMAWTQEHWTQYEHAIAAAEREKLTGELINEAQLEVQRAVLAEREACAKVCKDIANSQFESGETETAGVLDHCAAAIRARSII